jgi:hypothetical protein
MSGNPNPYQARIASKRKRRARNGSLATAQRVLWNAILRVEEALETASGTEMVVKCTHALSQSLASYGKLIEIGELEARLKALEGQLKDGAHG